MKRRAPDLVTIVVSLGIACGCAPDRAPSPPDREALAERQTRLEEAAARMGEIATATTRECLVHAGHPDPRVRRAVALRLMEIGPSATVAVPELITLLRDDEPRVRTAAARALGVLGGEAALDPLISALVDQDAEVRLWSWKALHRQGDKAHAAMAGHLTPRSAIADRSYIDEQGTQVLLRSELRRMLPVIGAPIVPHLLANLEQDEEGLLVNTMRVLWQIGPAARDAIPALIRLLETGNQELRFQSARALGAIGDLDPAVIPALKQASKDPTDQVRRTAKRALKDISKAAREAKPKRHGQAAERHGLRKEADAGASD